MASKKLLVDLEVSGDITANNLSGTNTGDQNLSGYLLNTTDTLTGTLTMASAAVPFKFEETGYTGEGKYWRHVQDSGGLRFDSCTAGDGLFTPYVAGLQLSKSGAVKFGGLATAGFMKTDAAGNVSIDTTTYSTTDTTYVSSDFTHDDLTGFVANEHIDWTIDQGATNIHSGNYTDTNTFRAIHDTPVDAATTTSISSNWAFDNVKTAVPIGAVFTDTTYDLSGLLLNTTDTFDGVLTINTDTIPGLIVKTSSTSAADASIVIRGARNSPSAGINPAKLVLQSYDSDAGGGTNITGGEFYMEATSLTGGSLTDFQVGIRYRKDGSLIDGFNIHDGTFTVNGNISATNLSGTNTGDQDLSGYALSADYLPLTGGTLTGNLNVASGISTGEGYMQIGNGRTGSGVAYIDLVGDTTYSDYGLRIIRSAGANSNSIIEHRGTGAFTFQTAEGADILLLPNAGKIGIGTPTPGEKLEVNGSIKATGDVKLNENNKVIFDFNGDSFSYITSDAVGLGDNKYASVGEHHFINGESLGYEIVKAGSFVKDGGTSSQFLKANGSVDSNTYVTGSSLSNYVNTTTNQTIGGTKTFSNPVTAPNFILSSDNRLKENVEEVDNKSINVDWKTFEMKSNKGQKRYGVIAQELEEVHPEFVRTDEKGMKSVAYIDLLIAKNAELEARLEKLERLLLDK